MKRARSASVEQLVVGHAAPEKERQARRQLEIAEPIGVSGRAAFRVALDAEQEVDRHQQATEGGFDSGFEPRIAAVLAARSMVEVEEGLDFLIRRRPPVGAAGQGANDLRGARLVA